MADDKDATSVPLSQGAREDEEGRDPEDPLKSPPIAPDSSTRRACCFVLQSWVSKKFMTGCVVLFPVAITFFVTWWFVQFVDGFFSPLYAQLGIDIFDSESLYELRRKESTVGWPLSIFGVGLLLASFGYVFQATGRLSDFRSMLTLICFYIMSGLGFVTSLLFVFLVGVFVSSWLGATVFWIGEWFIKRMPFVKHLYSASKQISSAISPDQNSTAFKEVAIIRHPREGEYAFGFITSTVVLQRDDGDEELCSVFVPTNHLYIGDVLLLNSKDIIRPNLSIREGIEIIVSGGMTMPQKITPISPIQRVARSGERIPLNRL